MKLGYIASLHQHLRRKTIHGIILVFVVILAALAIGARKNMNDLDHLREVKEDRIRENLELVKKNKSLKIERDALHTPEHIEQVARDHFGLLKPDETVFVVEESK